MKRQQAGFTLVEIAIVLVIVGLLLGGVLKGQEIITNARIKNLENDFNGISAAIYSYQDRYRRLPGDDPGATRFIPVVGAMTVPTHVGGGNSIIEGDFNEPSDNTQESRLFWLHLRAAGLVSGVADITKPEVSFAQPLNAFGGIVGVSTDPYGTGAASTMPGLFVGYTRIPQQIAIILETRIDDNEVKSGTIQSDKDNYIAATNPLHELYFAL